MENKQLLQLARNTALKGIGEALMDSGTRYTLRLTGKEANLRAAQKLIKADAGEDPEWLETVIHRGAFPKRSSHLDISCDGDLIESPVPILSLVHKATQCDIGATVKAKVYKEKVSEENEEHDFSYQPEEDTATYRYVPGIVVDCDGLGSGYLLRVCVMAYLEDKLRTMSKMFKGAEPIQFDPHHKQSSQSDPQYTQIYQYTDERLPNEFTAQTRAIYLAEQAARALNLPDASVELDKEGYGEEYER